MNERMRVFREKRLYNKWVASETLEDYALRYTADVARHFSARRVAATAIGASAFLACEAIGASITLAYGFSNTIAAIVAACVLMFLVGLPIAYHAAKEGLDIDLLTRGAGFGYLGSTITSLIYASFTFLLFSVEASIMAVALKAMFGMPMWAAYLASALVVIPIAVYGMKAITRFQAWTQPAWIALQIAPVIYILIWGRDALGDWVGFAGGSGGKGVELLYFGLAFSTLLSLLPQIGEQADYLRFLPSPKRVGKGRWWWSVIVSGPGWVVIGGAKLALGSLLAHHALQSGLGAAEAASPTTMFSQIFTDMTHNREIALVLTAVFVIIAQMKINVTNAYAGSIAWSNFFARLTQNHPGRVVWLVFNVLLATLLMETGSLGAIDGILIVYANIASAWIGALAADLAVSKPLGLSPRGIEFKRAHLFDVNPVGIGAAALSLLASTTAQLGLAGPLAQAFAPAIGLAVAFVAAPAIALATHGRYYLARTPSLPEGDQTRTCVICENDFQTKDMAQCPVYSGPICSLCCTLESRCRDRCKEQSQLSEQLSAWLGKLVPAPAVQGLLKSTIGQFIMVLTGFFIVISGALFLIYRHHFDLSPEDEAAIRAPLYTVFFVFLLLSGLASWLIVLAHKSRMGAERETSFHMENLIQEIAAHEATDAALQRAKEAAESANAAKSRYLVSVSHEIRSPLNAIYGYAQLLERGGEVTPRDAAKVIRRSAEHLTNLVEGLMDLSQVESGVLRLARDQIRLPAYFEQLADMFRPQAQAKGIEFYYDPPPWLPEFVRGDQKRLRQILINVISNAVKFTDQGYVRLSVAYRNDLVTVTVEDTGLGIGEDDLKRIFEPFQRASSPSAQHRQGIGLGLTITGALIQIMGGDISVRSERGKGSTFVMKLMLPRSREQQLEVAGEAPIAGYVGAQRTIMLVDDDPTQLAILKAALEPLQFAVFTASDGESSVALAGKCQPDLVLLDLTMPGISGWETARRLRDRFGKDLKIVLVSANAHELQRAGQTSDIHDGYLLKPVDLDALLDYVRIQLGLEWAIEPPTAAARPPTKVQDAPALTLSAQAILLEIGRLSSIGHVRAIEAQLSALENEPGGQLLSGVMRARLEEFDFDGLARLSGRVET